jgi:hypothetical protein
MSRDKAIDPRGRAVCDSERWPDITDPAGQRASWSSHRNRTPRHDQSRATSAHSRNSRFTCAAVKASSFVLGLSMGRGNGIRTLILLGYANYADEHGRGAYPSTQTIADYAECDVRTVQRHVGWLISRGYLREGGQQMVDHLDPRYRPIVYDVALSDEQVAEWASNAGSASGHRAPAIKAGRRGGKTSAQVSRGGNPSPLADGGSPQVSRGDSLSPPGQRLQGSRPQPFRGDKFQLSRLEPAGTLARGPRRNGATDGRAHPARSAGAGGCFRVGCLPVQPSSLRSGCRGMTTTAPRRACGS